MKTAALFRLLALGGLFSLVGCFTVRPGPAPHAKVPDRPEDVQPIRVGAALPPLRLTTPEGESFRISKDVGRTPFVLVFYRGGWCPYCNRHLADLQTVEADFVRLGVPILAISPDRPEKLRITAGKEQLSYRLLSDSEMTAARQLGLAFRLDDATVAKYRDSYKIDIEADSGHDHHLLPVPAAILVDRKGIVRFVHADPDYKVRIDAKELLQVAKQLVQ